MACFLLFSSQTGEPQDRQTRINMWGVESGLQALYGAISRQVFGILERHPADSRVEGYCELNIGAFVGLVVFMRSALATQKSGT